MMKNKFNAIILAFLAVTVLFVSCSKDDNLGVQATVGFAQETFAIDVDNQATLKLVSSTPLTNGESVSFTVGGTLVAGQDYELSADQFVFANGSKEATVKVTLLKELDETDLFEVNLNPIAFGALALSKASVGIQTGDVILYSFDKPNYTMNNTVSVALELSKVTGSFTAEKAIAIQVDVDTELSTAVEGTHFSFTNGSVLTIPAGQNKGNIQLTLLKQEAGKDKIVLKLKSLPLVFKPGNYDLASIIVFGSSFEKLEGSWKYVTMANRTWWETNNAYMGDNMDLLPVNNTDKDILTFDESGLKLSLTGDLKNYFREGPISYVKEEEEVLQETGGIRPPRVNIDLIKSLVNINFSATEKEEREAEVGYRVFTDNGKEYLEVTIRDYEPTDFLQEIFNAFNQSWNTDVPLMKSMPLRFHFERAE